MKKTYSEHFFDKGVDILVVVFGILIALSIDSYRETKKAERQWSMFAKHFISDATNMKKSYTEISHFYSEQYKIAQNLLTEMQKRNTLEVKGLEEFLPKMGQIKADFQKDTMFAALVQSGNAFLIDDADRLQNLGLMYSFETLAMSNVQTLSEHFIPDYKRILKMYYAKKKNDPQLIADVIFLFHNYTRQMLHNKNIYEEQVKVVDKALKSL